jgi:hypothetical protein
MDAHSWPLVVRKAYGLVSGTTLDVRSLPCAPDESLILTKKTYAALRRVLHLKMVTQCAMLDDFGIFLVLADKVCYSIISSMILNVKPFFFFAVTFRVPYRGACTLHDAKCTYVTNATKAEWKQGRAFLHSRTAKRADARDLHAQKRGEYCSDTLHLQTMLMNGHSWTAFSAFLSLL